MIIWINGAFGAGKTTAAYELNRRLADSFVYDPENVGFFLRENLPEACCRDDFQDIPLWRRFNYQILKEIHKTCGSTVIVPMTLVNPDYYEEIIQRLLDDGIPLAHVILCAGRETIIRRLKKRSFSLPGREDFAVAAIDRCLHYFDHHSTGIRITTDDMSVEQIVTRIGRECGLPLMPDRRGRVQSGIDRLKMLIGHIRW